MTYVIAALFISDFIIFIFTLGIYSRGRFKIDENKLVTSLIEL